ncbi:MAG TPA: AAA family ATPase [Clostridia bacterium]|nr:AAA family ATPase [Clostridia bacterium]
MFKEIGLGVGLAMIAFLVITGYDIVPFILILCIGGLLFYMAKSRGLIGNLSGKQVTKVRHTATFEDIGGQKSAITELREALDFICNVRDIKKLGIRPLKGILLTGPPGTGKTLMARAAASYTDALFLATSGSEFIEMYAGVGAQRIRNLFRNSRKKAVEQDKKNVVIFLDEIEILGGKRGKTTSHLEYDQTLNQLLVELDGINTDDEIRVLVIGATNRADMLDSALLRPGRFDRQVRVDLPDKDGRLEILRLHTKNKPLGDDVRLDTIAREAFGFSGAHIESLANEAAILAMRGGANVICQKHFNEAIDKVIMGDKLDRIPSCDELRRVAIHETGHAVVSEWVSPESVSTLTVTPRSGALGYTRQVFKTDTYLYTKDDLENRIAVLLAGALAEEVVLGNKSNGSAKDIEEAVKAAEIIINSGMSELGVVGAEFLPQKEKHRILLNIIQKQDSRIRTYLNTVKDALLAVVDRLIEQERVSGEELRGMLKKIYPVN